MKKDNIILYNLDGIKIAGLNKYKDLTRERELKNGKDTLSFLYPKKSSENIKEECYVETRENLYVIKEVDKSDKDWVQITAKINTDGLKQRIFPHFETVNSQLADTLNLALAGTGWTIGHNDIIKRRTIRLAWCTPLEIIGEIRKIYRAEIFYDARNKKINVYEKYGEDKGHFFMEDVNLKELSISSDTHDYITRLIPIGKDGMTIDEINNGKNYLENYQYSNKIIYGVWEDNRYSVVENLKEDGEVKLDELSKPLISYEGNSTDLRGADLGDTIELVSKTNNVKERQRVVKITEYPLKPWENKVEIANKVLSFEEQFNEVEEVVETADTVLTSDGMIDESKVDFNPIRQEFVTIIAEKADIRDLNAAVARIGNLEATKANITDLEAVNARIDNLYAEDLKAVNAEITYLKGRVGEIDTILSKEIFVELAEVGQIVAGSGIIAEGAIGDAQISSLTAGKIRSGTIDTSLVTVAGSDGKLNITGNRLQVIHEGLERVALGDVNRDGTVYGLRVRGEDGETVLFDERGITKEGITEGSIDDSKVDDSANIQGHKLDINSVIREVNDADEVIKGTKVQVGDRTLDVELSTLETSISDNAEEISHQRTQIQALDDAIKLKVDNQAFTEYKSVTDENITTINTQLTKNTSSIDILQEQIKLKVEQVDIENAIADMEIGGRNLLPNSQMLEMHPNINGYGTSEFMNDEKMPYWRITADEDKSISTFTDTLEELNVLPLEEGEDYTFSVDVRVSEGAIVYLQPSDTFKVKPNIWTRIYTTRNQGTQTRALGLKCDTLTTLDYRNYKVEKGNKATDWSPAPEDFESEITVINTKMAEIDINLEGITSRVQETEYDLDDVTNKVTTLEQTSEDFAISIRKYEDGIFEGATYTFDGNNAVFRGAGLKIQDDFGKDQLWQDTQGNLSMMGVLTTYQNDKKAIEIKGNNVFLYDWEGTPRYDFIGSIATGRRDSNPDMPGISIRHVEDAHTSITYRGGQGAYRSYMDFDNYNKLGTSLGHPISLNRATLFKDDALFLNRIRLQHNKTPWIQKNPGNDGLEFVVSGASNGGYAFKNASGSVYHNYLPGRDYPFIFYNHTRVEGNFTTTGKKNALHETEHYGERLINSYEMAEYYSGDLGTGQIAEDGLCYIYIDDIFDETISTKVQYHVFLQKCGQGDIWVKERHENYFVVEGTPGLNFSWELKAKRDGYEYDRLESPTNIKDEEFDLDFLLKDEEEKQAKEELKNMIDYELTFDLADYVLGGEEFENTH